MKFCFQQQVMLEYFTQFILVLTVDKGFLYGVDFWNFDCLTGKDATNDFEDVGHSDDARKMMDKYYIGEIDASTVPLKHAYVPPQQTPYNPDKTPEFVIKILQFLVPLLILGLAFVVRHYTKEK